MSDMPLQPEMQEEPSPPTVVPLPSLRERAIRGSIWTLGGYAVSQVVRLAGNIILARLLFPEAFGLASLVGSFIQGLQMFSDVGIGPSIIQNRRGDDPVFLNTAWTIQVIRGGAIWIVACLIAWPIAQFYQQPLLLWLVPVVGLNTLMGGFNSTALFTMNRHLSMGLITIIDLGCQLAAMAAMIALASVYPSVWAVVVGGLVSTALRLVLSHTLLPGMRNRFQWDRESRQQLFDFGRWIFVSTVLTFLASQSDRLVFGKIITMAELGVYSIAVGLAAMPTMAVLRLGSTIAFPAFSRAAADLPRLQSAFRTIRRPLLVGGGWLVTCMISGGPGLITALYKPVYHEAAIIVQIVSIGAWFQILESINGSAILSLGASRWLAVGNAVKLGGILVMIPVGFWMGGFHGAIIGMVITDCLKYAVSVLAVRKYGLRGFGQDILLTLMTAAASMLSLTTVKLLAPSWHFGAIVIAGIAATLLWAPWGLGLLQAARKSSHREAASA